jgi:hypothetical protein
MSEFLQRFDSQLSKQLNALRGETHANFARDPSIMRIADAGGILRQSVYTLTNPLKVDLVEFLREWKGSSSIGLEYGQVVTFARPERGIWAPTRGRARRGRHPSRRRLAYRGRSKAPPSVTFALARPAIRPELSDAELRKEVVDAAEAREAELMAARKKARRGVLGWNEVLRTSHTATPRTSRVLFQRRPRVTGTDPAKCAAVLSRVLGFEADYYTALARFRGAQAAAAAARQLPTRATRKASLAKLSARRPAVGVAVEFPYGTLQMVTRYGVPCATAPP